MAKTQVARLNHRHNAIVNWLVTNPHKSLGECAMFFGYTQSWLSQVINSDMFQLQYQERCREAGCAAVWSITNRLSAVTALVLDEAKRKLETGVASERFVSDVMRSSLQALGFGSAHPPADTQPQQHLHLHVSAEELELAREKAALARTGQTQAKSELVAVTAGDRLVEQLKATGMTI